MQKNFGQLDINTLHVQLHSARGQEDIRLRAGCGTHADHPQETFTFPLTCTVYRAYCVKLILKLHKKY